MKRTLIVTAVLAAGVTGAAAQSIQLEQPAQPDTTRDRALMRLRDSAPGDLEAASDEQRRSWRERAEQVLRERFPAAADEVRVEVTPLGIVRLTGRAPNLATKLAMARAIMERPDIGVMVDNALAPFEGEQATATQ